jgi:type IV pilus assembly protein PilA
VTLQANDHATKVCRPRENKAFARKVPRTKVTGGFGEAGANIRDGCDVCRDFKTELTRGNFEMRKQKGFSLIELLIVVAIILIIAAIAIPNLMRARMSANESSAVGGIRTINTAEVSYNATFPAVGFTSVLANLGGSTNPCTATSTNACLIDAVLSGGTKSGYTFSVGAGAGTGTPAPTYNANATPVTRNQTGIRDFCSFEDGVVRYSSATISGCPAATAPLQ